MYICSFFSLFFIEKDEKKKKKKRPRAHMHILIGKEHFKWNKAERKQKRIKWVNASVLSCLWVLYVYGCARVYTRLFSGTTCIAVTKLVFFTLGTQRMWLCVCACVYVFVLIMSISTCDMKLVYCFVSFGSHLAFKYRLFQNDDHDSVCYSYGTV